MRQPKDPSTHSIDPVTIQLIRGSLRAARLECELIIERTAMSAFIREKKDYTVSFLDAEGHEIIGDTMGSDIMGCVWEFYPALTMRPGDLYWYNDPYLSKGSITHTPDMVFIAPVFHENEIVGYCHSFAHFWDLGGSRPGSIGPSNTEIFHDGTLVPPIKIIDNGTLNEEAYRIILRNSRYPDLLEGDSNSLMSATGRAQERLTEMFDQFGHQTLLEAIEQEKRATATMIRTQTLAAIPEGEYEVRDYLDHGGLGKEWHSFHLSLKREGDHITLDSTQSDDQTTGSINFLASHGTLSAYFGQHFHQYDPSLLSNHGLSAGIDEVKLRQGSILQPEWPAALGCRAHTFTKLKGAVRAVLAQATSGQVMAGTAVYVIAYWRMRDTNGQWILCTDGIAVGHGARPFSDGLDAIYQRHNENYPGEFMEMEYPLRMERYAIMPDSGGAGKFRGGCGVIREVRLLADTGTFGLRVENNIFPTWGVSGGMGGGTSSVTINPGSPHEAEIQGFSDDNVWNKGDLVRICTAGGGGWGDPLDREPDKVLDDVKDGFVSFNAAIENYGVVINPNSLLIDLDATRIIREQIRSDRGPTKLFHRINYFDSADEELKFIESTFPR